MEIHQANFPKQFRSNVQFKHKFRFQSTGAAFFTILRSDLLGLLAVNLTGALTNAAVIAGIKLNRMEFYAVGGATAAAPFTPATVSVEWLSQYGPSAEISDVGNAFAPAKIVVSPPRQSVASFWTLTGFNVSEVLCNVIVPIGTIADVFVDIVLVDSEASVIYTTIAAGVAGQMYAGYLDRHAGAGAVMQPVSYVSLN